MNEPLTKAITAGLVLASMMTSCTNGASCPAGPLHVTVLSLPPYAFKVNGTSCDGIMCVFLENLVRRCFGDCNLTAHPVEWNFVDSTSALVASLLSNATDVAVPIIHAVETALDEYDESVKASGESYPHIVYYTIVKSPGVSYIVHVEHLNDAARAAVVSSLTAVWPVIVIVLLLAAIAGILVWVLEFKINRSEFPKNFLYGSYEGFWWAFVSMTTVGYGDKTPKSILGRMFGVIWILIGLVLIGTFTAAATSALAAGASYYTAGPQGKRIGVFNNTMAEVEAVRMGAKTTSYAKFDKMQEDLTNNKLDGLLIDRFEASDILNKLNNANIRVLRTLDVVTAYKAARIPKRTAALANRCATERLAKATRLSHHLIGDYVKPVPMYESAEHSYGFFAIEQTSTVITIAALAGLFAGLLLFGVLYQYMYRRIAHAGKSYKPDDNATAMDTTSILDLQKSMTVLAEQVTTLQAQLYKFKPENYPADRAEEVGHASTHF